MPSNAKQIAANLVPFYLGWFACVIGAGRGAGLAGPAVAAIIVAAHVIRSEHRLRSLELVLLSLLLGTVVDGSIAGAGLVSYAAHDLPAPLPPSWILCLWALFATTFDVAMRWLDPRPLLAAVLGFVFGAPSYLAAARLGAVEVSDRLDHLLVLGLIWALALWVMSRASERAHRLALAPTYQKETPCPTPIT